MQFAMLVNKFNSRFEALCLIGDNSIEPFHDTSVYISLCMFVMFSVIFLMLS